MLSNLFFIFLWCAFAVLSQISLKKGLLNAGGLKLNSFLDFLKSFLNLFKEPYMYLGGILGLAATFTFIMIISRKDLTATFPLTTGGFYIFLFLFSVFFLGESISFWKVIGTLIIIIGAWIVISASSAKI